MQSSPSSAWAERNERLVASVVWLMRLAVGGVFLLSGFTKSVDLWGVVFKMEEYLASWGMHEPRTVVLAAAACLSWGEFVLGALTVLGCYRRSTAWLPALAMAFMLPLTAYIWHSNPVSDCGCFGDFLVLSNQATFWKNVVITACIIPLLLWNKRVKGLFVPYTQWIVGAWLTLFIAATGILGYCINPLLDFRRFETGTKLVSDSDVAPDAQYLFIYERNGERREFSEDELPDAGEGWEFVDRRLISGSEEADDGLTVMRGDEDVTAEMIDSEGLQMLVVAPEVGRVSSGQTYFINELSDEMERRGGRLTVLLSPGERGMEYWRDISMSESEPGTVDGTVLKGLVRGNPGVVMLRDGVIQWKSTLSWLETKGIQGAADGPNVDGAALMRGLVGTCVAGLMALWLIDRTGLGIHLVLSRKRRREAQRQSKSQNLQKNL